MSTSMVFIFFPQKRKKYLKNYFGKKKKRKDKKRIRTEPKDGVNTHIHTYGQIRQSFSRPRFMDTSNNILLHHLSRSDWTHLSYLALSSSLLVFPRSISITLCRLVYITNHILVLHLFLFILSV